MTSYQLPRQHTGQQKGPLGKTKSVKYRFYFFMGNLPKFFNLLESMTKSYLVDLRYIEKWHIILYKKLY